MTEHRDRLARRLAPVRVSGVRVAWLVAVGLTCLAWGTVGLLVRQLELPAVTIAGFRLGFAAVALAALGLARPGTVGWLPVGHGRRVVLLGALMAVNWWLFILAFQLTQIGVTVVLSFTWPVWVALLSRGLDLEPPDRATIIALLVSVTGVALIAVQGLAVPGSRDLAGMAAALTTSFVMAAMVLVSRSIDGSLASTTISFWQAAVAAALLAPFTLAGAVTGTLDLRALGILVVLGVVLTGIGQTLFLRGMRTLSVPETAVMSYLEPLSATVLAAVFLAEWPGPRSVLGMALIVGAGLWVVLVSGRATVCRPSDGVSAK